MSVEPRDLFALAEISVALAGFSAIVVLFKRGGSGQWRAADADRFHGMVLHAVAAAVFCVMPSVVGVFAASPGVVWGISSTVLGLQILLHVAVVLNLRTTGPGSRASLALGVLAAGLQGVNVVGVGFEREFGPYLLGVLWHLLQSGVLFVWLIWIPESDIEPS